MIRENHLVNCLLWQSCRHSSLIWLFVWVIGKDTLFANMAVNLHFTFRMHFGSHTSRLLCSREGGRRLAAKLTA